ncbi:MAG TPA: hypothetical protein VNG33_20505 [Polyangiaceae bacterium]|nr:hypothetical protein [Polyangiaceae bacterium]
MSEAALAPTLANFDAVVAAKSAALESKAEPPDTTENDEATEVDESELEEVDSEAEPDSSDEEEAGDEEEGDEEQPDDPTVEPVEAALRAPFKAFREAIKSKRITPELMNALGDLEMEVETVNGPVKMRMQEMGGHIMREARFSREMAKAKEAQASSQRIVQIEQARTNAWRQNPNELEHGLMIMGCGPALDALHKKWAQETYNFLNLPPHEQQRIQFERQVNAERERERIRVAQLERELQQVRQQAAPQIDEPTRQAGEYIHQNMDRVLGSALKAAGAGRISDELRLGLVNEMTELAQEGYPLPQAMAEAARTVAERERKMQRLAQGQHDKQAKEKPEVSGRRAPAGNAPPKRDDGGRFQPARTGNGSSKRKVDRTAAGFGERFGV